VEFTTQAAASIGLTKLVNGSTVQFITDGAARTIGAVTLDVDGANVPGTPNDSLHLELRHDADDATQVYTITSLVASGIENLHINTDPVAAAGGGTAHVITGFSGTGANNIYVTGA